VDLGFEYGEGEFDTATDAELDAEALLKEKMLVASLREDAELGGELAQKEDGGTDQLHQYRSQKYGEAPHPIASI